MAGCINLCGLLSTFECKVDLPTKRVRTYAYRFQNDFLKNSKCDEGTSASTKGVPFVVQLLRKFSGRWRSQSCRVGRERLEETMNIF